MSERLSFMVEDQFLTRLAQSSISRIALRDIILAPDGSNEFGVDRGRLIAL